MTKVPKDKTSKTLSSKNKPSPANQAWRDRLNKQIASQGAKQAGTLNRAAQTNARNPFQNSAPSNSSRKTRKGLRPG